MKSEFKWMNPCVEMKFEFKWMNPYVEMKFEFNCLLSDAGLYPKVPKYWDT